MIRDLADLAEAAGGRLHGYNREFGLVSTDSRTLPAGALFVALRGERFDGHEFLPDAARAGAAGALVERVSEIAARVRSCPGRRRRRARGPVALRPGPGGAALRSR